MDSDADSLFSDTAATIHDGGFVISDDGSDASRSTSGCDASGHPLAEDAAYYSNSLSHRRGDFNPEEMALITSGEILDDVHLCQEYNQFVTNAAHVPADLSDRKKDQ